MCSLKSMGVTSTKSSNVPACTKCYAVQYDPVPDSERVEAVQFTLSPTPAELTAATVIAYSWSGDRPVTVYSDE